MLTSCELGAVQMLDGKGTRNARQMRLVLTLRQGLGLSIVVGASMVKLPQILAVRNSKSAEGLSRIAYELEEIGLAVMSANGFVMGLPFSAFGEAVFLLIQNTFLLGQIYYYSKTPASRGLAGATALAAWFAAVALGETYMSGVWQGQ